MALDDKALAQAKRAFDTEGYALLPSLFTTDEVAAVRELLIADDGCRKWAYEGTVKMVSFVGKPGDDVLGRVARCRRVHDLTAKMLGEPTTVHHTQAVLKEPHSHFSLAWHQDYGYQYHGGILAPHMCTVFIAIDPCNRANGGLEVMAGSHICGRLDHAPKDPSTRQLTVDADRLKLLEADGRFELRQLDMSPGDTVVLSCVLLHRSGPNTSGHTRYALNMAYNAMSNVTKNPTPSAPPTTDSSNHTATDTTDTAAMDGHVSTSAHHDPHALPAHTAATTHTQRRPVVKGREGVATARAYDIVHDEEVIKGSVGLDVSGWGVVPIPLKVHTDLEWLRRGKPVGGGGGNCSSIGGGGGGGDTCGGSSDGGRDDRGGAVAAGGKGGCNGHVDSKDSHAGTITFDLSDKDDGERSVVRDAVEYKCRALKLVMKEEDGGRRIVVERPCV